MKHALMFLLLLLALLAVPAAAQDAPRPRVLVSSDIGGTDPDDQQSMAHFLLYANMFEIEGIVSSPPGPGRKRHILEVIDAYEKDYAKLKQRSARYSTPDSLRVLAKQGTIDSYGDAGFGAASEGSDWIIRAARRSDPRPLWVLVWGGIDDLAQALHDAPDIEPKIRVYFIGGPNKMWSANAFNYIEQHHPKLWIIEANSTYRGWFTGGNQSGDWSNAGFVAKNVAGHGALGEYFAALLKGVMKMGDSPSIAYLLHGTPDDPTQPGWGGRFVRAWDDRETVFTHHTSDTDRAEAFGIVEWSVPLPAGMAKDHTITALFDERVPMPVWNDGKTLRFRFSPRDAKVWRYRLQSTFPALDGKTGSFTAVQASPEKAAHVSRTHPNWWLDDADPAAAEGIHAGARHVSKYREAYLTDFATRLP
jgi:hypothetical protein